MIETKDLVYVFPDSTVGISPSTMTLPTSSRTLLIGANGAGKSTLLRILAGKTLAKAGAVHINGQDPFRDGLKGITYLGTEWAGNPMVRQDIPVVLLLSSIGGNLFPERRDQLIDILDIDLSWHMHQVSDGERRRVQLAMGLLRPWDVLLLDEVTVDLDVLVRARLLDFLMDETKSRPCQIIYATHIFDGLSEWPTHVVHMHMSKVVSVDTYDEVIKQAPAHTRGTPLLELAYSWLSADLTERGARTAKRKWQDLENEMLSHGPLESKDRGMDQYFSALRGHK